MLPTYFHSQKRTFRSLTHSWCLFVYVPIAFHSACPSFPPPVRVCLVRSTFAVLTWIKSLFVAPSAVGMPPSMPSTSAIKAAHAPTARSESRRRAPSARDEPSHAVMAPKRATSIRRPPVAHSRSVKEEHQTDDDEDTSSLYMLGPGRADEDDDSEEDVTMQESEGSDEEAEDEVPSTSTSKSSRQPRGARKYDRRSAYYKRELSVESNDSDSTESSSPRKRTHYMVTDTKTGRPAERFRTDILTSIRTTLEYLPDPDPSVPSGSIRITDKWREEWSHGVQVPIDPKNLPRFETKPCDIKHYSKGPFRLPRGKYLLSQSAPRYEKPETHVVYAPPPLRIYQGDRLDELWLEKINQEHEHNFLPVLTFSTLLNLMNEFEMECFQNIHRIVLSSLSSPSSSLNTADMVDEDAPCDVCQLKDGDDDPMIFCDGCNVCLHLSCYDLTDIPDGNWECDMCKAVGFARHDRLKCQLCPNSGGAMKELEEGGKWVHVSCAMWIPEVRFIRKNGREVIASLDCVSDERWQLKCSICDLRAGACIQCGYQKCTTSFHTTCAQRSKVCDVVHDRTDNNDCINFQAYCKKHTAVMRRQREGYTGESVNQSDDESDERSDVLRALERAFFLHVQFEDVAKKLGVPMLHASDVYEYWKQKRSDNGGRPLISCPQMEIEVDTDTPILALASTEDTGDDQILLRASEDVQHQLTPFQLKCWRFQKYVFQSLDKGRLGCDLIMKRERRKREILEAERNIFNHLVELDSQPGVPISQRSVADIVGEMQSGMSAEEMAETDRMAEQWIAEAGTPRQSKTTTPTTTPTTTITSSGGVRRKAELTPLTTLFAPSTSRSSSHSIVSPTMKENGLGNTRNPLTTPSTGRLSPKKTRHSVRFDLPPHPPSSPSPSSTPPSSSSSSSTSTAAGTTTPTTSAAAAARSRRLRPQNPPHDDAIPSTSATIPTSAAAAAATKTSASKLRERREVKYF